MQAARTYSFRGGLDLPDQREPARSAPVRAMPLPARLFLPLTDHIGTEADVCVAPGDEVCRGATLARPSSYVSTALLAPADGVVEAIAPHPAVARPAVPTVTLATTGTLDDTLAFAPIAPGADCATLVRRVRDAGVIGMGGAGFPTQVKLGEGQAQSVDLLIINGVESEPLLSCDDCLLRQHLDDVIDGAQLIGRMVDAQRVVLAVTEDRDDLDSMRARTADSDVEVAAVTRRYPSGSERQLIRLLTGRDVPLGGLPIDLGVLVHNVATTHAVQRAIHAGEANLARFVTVTGAVTQPGNYLVPFGCAIGDLLDVVGVEVVDFEVLAGGTMTGRLVDDLRAPVTRTTNGLVVRPRIARSESPCIRCGECVEVCPMLLQPHRLVEFARADDAASAQEFALFSCIECGCCDAVCPSQIPLVDSFRQAKSSLQRVDREADVRGQLKSRFEAKNERSARPGPRERVSRAPSVDPVGESLLDYVTASVQRARQRRAQRPGTGAGQDDDA